MTNAQSRTRRDHQLWDDAVNALWDGQWPVLSPEESIAAARKLYRHAMGRTWESTGTKRFPHRWAPTSGNRFTYPVSGVFYVNPDRRGSLTPGLRGIIHTMSHYCHRRLHPQDKPHSIRQLRLEAKLTKFAIARRWHEGALKREAAPQLVPDKPDVVQQRYARMVRRRDKYEAELARIARLAKKARSEVREYERRHKNRLGANQN